MNTNHRVTLRRLLLAATILSSPWITAATNPAAAQVSISVSVPVAPPALPIYDQPQMPDAGYIWTPGYWSWDQADGYYWVPGTWVLPPQANVLWTPPYWGWGNGGWLFHDGYWGQQVGYYGGVNYGYGYSGQGYQGGRWEGGHFSYNSTVNNFGSVHVPNVYKSNVRSASNSHVSYEGGTGGLQSTPNAAERQAGQQKHVPMTAEQTSHITAAAKLPNAAASHNGGHPAVVATSRPNQFEGSGVVRSEQSGHAAAKPGPAAEHTALPPLASPSAPHAAAPPPGAHPEEHVTAPPAQREAPAPADHASALPPERAAPPQAQHEAPPPAEHAAAPPPVQHAQAQPAAPHAAPAEAHPAPAEKEKDK